MLETAIQMALWAHSGQTDKGGQPYILHPLRVMMAMQTEHQKIVAILHDVLEDSGTKPTDILEAFGQEVLDDVLALTRLKGEAYDAFIQRCKANETARVVKLADLADNMNLSRLGREPTEKDLARRDKYERASHALFND